MKKQISFLLLLTFLFTFFAKAQEQNYGSVTFPDDGDERGYFDRPYKRYEAEPNKCVSNGTFLTATSDQREVQSEASNQVATQLVQQNSYVQWKNDEAADGMVIRFSIPDAADGKGTNGKIALYVDNTHIQDIELNSYWAWQYIYKDTWANKYPDNEPDSNDKFPRMRFDDVRVKLDAKIPKDAIFKLVKIDDNTTPYTIDFVELEPIAPIRTFASIIGDKIEYDGSDLQTFIDDNGGKIIYIPEGVYYISDRIHINTDNTQLIGAGMWHTQLHFTAPSDVLETHSNRGLSSTYSNIVLDGLYLTTVNNQRYYEANSNYQVGKALMGSFGSNSVIKNIWAEHFECGGWIADYTFRAVPTNLLVQHCRFRNNYADGINLCVGSNGCIVEHCSFRNNGDDDMASWSSLEMCENNTYRYNTAENNWRASSLGFFGGKNNKAHNCVIIDGMEAGLRINCDFEGTGFGTDGMNEFYDISIYRCGAKDGNGVPGINGDLWGAQRGAIEINSSWSYILQNVKFSNIDIYDSRNNAIEMISSGKSVKNLSMEDIYVNGTKGYGIHFSNLQGSNITYCNLQFENTGIAISNTIPAVFKPMDGCDEISEPGTNINNIPDIKNGIIATSNNGTIQLSNIPQGQKLSVYNLLGSKVYQINNTKEQETVTGLPEGMYVITVENTSLKVLVTK